MFILMAQYATKSGITKQIFDGARAWVGHHRGGMAVATVLSCAGMGAVSGSSNATAAMMSSIAVPEMTRLGYDKRLSLGPVSSSAPLDMLITPSVVVIHYVLLIEH